MFLEPSWVYVSGGKFLKCEYSLMLGGRGSIKVSSCSTSRIFQSGTNGNIIGRAHGLRSRHKYSTFHVRKARSGFLTVCVKIRVRGRRIRKLCISQCTSTSATDSWHQRTKHGFQTFRWHLFAYHCLLQSSFLFFFCLFVFHLSDLSS